MILSSFNICQIIIGSGRVARQPSFGDVATDRRAFENRVSSFESCCLGGGQDRDQNSAFFDRY